MIYLTGDTHGLFTRIESFCEKMNTTHEDLLIILGDAGINFSGGWRDENKKRILSELSITLLCIHGNHEKRPATIPAYKEQMWHGGVVYAEEKYPNILFAKDGEVYDLNGKKAIAIGGAYSIDKWLRTPGVSWWEDEQPSPEIKAKVEEKLQQLDWKVDIVLTHTTPLKYEPVETFLPGIDQSSVDQSTEEWLDTIEDRLAYDHWFCGHFHTCKKVDKIQLMFEDYKTLE